MNVTTEAFVRAGRTLVAALIASAITVLPQVVGVFSLDPAYTTAIIVGITALLNGVGKALRDPTIAVNGDPELARKVLDESPQPISASKNSAIPF